MELFQNFNIFILVSFYHYTRLVFAVKLTGKTFSHNLEYQGKTCPIDDHVFSMKVRRKTACAEICSRTTECTAVTFTQSTFICTGCNGFYPSSVNLVDQLGALFYIGKRFLW